MTSFFFFFSSSHKVGSCWGGRIQEFPKRCLLGALLCPRAQPLPRTHQYSCTQHKSGFSKPCMILKAAKQPPEVSSVPKANKKTFGGCTEQEFFFLFFFMHCWLWLFLSRKSNLRRELLLPHLTLPVTPDHCRASVG